MPDRADPSEAVTLWRAMLRSTTIVGSQMRRVFARWDLTGAQWGVIRALAESYPRGLMLSEISESLLVSGGNVTGLIDRLEEAGHVRRVTNPEDRRVTLAELTEQGHRIYEELLPAHAERVGELLSSLSPEEQQQACALLWRIAHHVGDSEQSNTCDEK